MVDNTKRPEKPAEKPAAPAVVRTPGFVAVGTIVHQDEKGERVTFEHGQPVDLPNEHLKKLHKQGAVIKASQAQPPKAPGVEQEPAYRRDPETGMWIDAQGSTHADHQPDIAALNPHPEHDD